MKSLAPRDIRLVTSMAFVALLLVGLLLTANFFILRQVGVGGGFLLPWKAARAFLFEHVEPYSTTVSGFVQQQVYGRPAHPGENPYILLLPFHLLLLYFPLALFRDPLVAAALWMLLCELALLAFIFMNVRLTDWQPRTPFLAAFFLFSALSLYAIQALLSSSAVLLLAMLYAGILVSLRFELDELAGALIALAFSHWEIGILFMLLVLLRVVEERRWRVLAGFGMLSGVLLVVSFFVYPDWILAFLRALLANLRADYGVSPALAFARLWPGLGSRLGWGLTAALGMVLLLEWTAARRAEFRSFYWAACVTLAITPLFGFRTASENLVTLILPLALFFSVVRERWRAGYWLASALLFLITAFPWGLFFGPLFTRPLRNDLIFLFLPVFTVLGLYWIRWWALRPPRTWLQRASSNEYG